MERSILGSLFFSREAYTEISPYLDEGDFSDQGQIIFAAIQRYYEKDTLANKIDTDVFLSNLEREYPKHFEAFKMIVQSLEPVSGANLKENLLIHKRDATATRLAEALMTSNKLDVRELIEMYEQYEAGLLDEHETDREVFIGKPIDEIAENFTSDNLIQIYPHSLNEHLDGGVPLQTHIVLYAQPEVGKSMFSINAAAGLCRDGRKTLYVGNEDSAHSMLMRFVSRMSGMLKHEILADPREAMARAEDKGYENLVFASLPAGHGIGEVEELVRKHKPIGLFLDQLRHISFPGVQGEVEQLTRAGKAARRLTKRHNLVTVSVTQAADSANNKLILDQGDVYMSNTSIPGDADLLLGIGMNEQYKNQNRRMLSPCKNKISGNHSAFPVGVDPRLSKVISI